MVQRFWAKLLSNNDYTLVALVFLLWSLGRVLLPALQGYVYTMDYLSVFYTMISKVYVVMHGVVFLFALWLLVKGFPDFLNKRGKTALWQVTLYGYVVVVTAISFYFLNYELGM